eukprot:COSAG05_NODE_127_length_17241_cov_7.514817_18_plen_65_part_00
MEAILHDLESGTTAQQVEILFAPKANRLAAESREAAAGRGLFAKLARQPCMTDIYVHIICSLWR